MSESFESYPRSVEPRDAAGAGIEWIRDDVLLGLEQVGESVAGTPAGDEESLGSATRALTRTRAALALLGSDPWQLLAAESDQLGRALAGGRVRAEEDARELMGLALGRLQELLSVTPAAQCLRDPELADFERAAPCRPTERSGEGAVPIA